MGVLRGLRVVESSAFVAVPSAGMTLAQMGADVIRIDLPGGGMDAARWPVTPDGRSLFWAGMNKGKRSVAIDVADPRGRELAAELICAPGPDAGCFITNLPARGEMSFASLRERREDVIMVSLKGTRDGGPAVDYSVNPALGFPMATGPEGSADPVAHVLPAWDLIAGQMVALGLLAAERDRGRGRGGQLVELALKDVAAAVLGHCGIIGEVVVNGVDRPKYGNALYGGYGQDFLCADGRRVMVIGLTGRQWKSLVKVTGVGVPMAALGSRLGLDLNEEGARFRARDEITALLRPWFAARTVEDFAGSFDAAGVTWSVFRSFAEAVREDPDLSPENPMFHAVDQPGIGRFPVPASPISFGAMAPDRPRPAPELGQHTEEVLADVLGLASGQIGALMDSGVIAGPVPA
ncbi:CoA transferase [Amaricoccus solimangrovi]|uniref:2-methylfumaryl-CoA isomerase n=1 Tax=Amaricoccus solimangrovi TaxID=2589815 RepID=A0A501WZ06_9RHOB|nr:CoA transferase [Amaricoccus solimangrovi]TPE53584.1 2-methylfumaryl-CoA isomerase [Amaricoccus solimangrovi]